MQKELRWKLRFQNLQKAYKKFLEATALESYSDLEKAGLVKTFEFTFELCWKTLKDLLQSKGHEVNSPRDVLKTAYDVGLIKSLAWIDLLDRRNLLSHVYDEGLSDQAVTEIKTIVLPIFEDLIMTLEVS